MTAFEQYAPWYDLLYEDKDYAAEVAFVEQQLECHGVNSGKLLDLGCGTGIHAAEFSRRGWDVTGIDLSADMIRRAETQLANPTQLQIHFRQGDVRKSGPERDFDAVISLFHVASYQTSQTDLEAMLATAQAALKPKGIFLFDYWYGGAVLAQGVETRIKTVQRFPLRVTRIAQSVHNEDDAQVQVNYTLFCEDIDRLSIQRIDETHTLRYWFPFEIESSLRKTGFDRINHYAWMTTTPPGTRVWAAYSVARKIEDQ